MRPGAGPSHAGRNARVLGETGTEELLGRGHSGVHCSLDALAGLEAPCYDVPVVLANL